MISAPKEIFSHHAFCIFVHELGRKRVCALLDISKITLQRWLSESYPVPKMASMALYWETSYGKSLIESDQVNEIRLLYRRVRILEDQYARAKNIITGLREIHTGTANEAFFDDMPELNPTGLNTYGTSKPSMAADPVSHAA